MGIFDFIQKGAQELFIARPDQFRGALIYKHPDPTIPNNASITVGQDEIALFYKDQQFVGAIQPGPPTKLETKNWPFLSGLIDKFTGGNLYRAELWFITTREIAGLTFGGRIGDLEDPKTGLAVGTMVHGQFSLQVEDPQKVIGFFGQRSWSNDDEFMGWFKQQLLKTVRDRTAELLVKQNTPLLNVTSGAMTEELEKIYLDAVQPHVAPYGIRIHRLGDVQVKIKPEDEAELKALYKDAAQIKLGKEVGGYQAFAAGKAMMGAAEGMKNGGGGGGGDNPMLAGAGMGIGMGMASMFNQQAQQNANAQQNAQQEAQKAAQAARFSGPDMVLAIEKIKKLKDSGILNDVEFVARKQKLIGELKNKTLSDGPEDFLASMIPLIEAGTLSPDDVQSIKTIVLA